MILLFGTRASLIEMAIVRFVCSFCGVNAAQQIYKRVNRFTLFFVPLFTVSTKHYVQCSNCGGTTALTREQADNGLAWAASRPA
jgi:hypothetical protein